MKVTILNVKNASELPSFTPVEGEFSINGTSDERDYNEVVSAIEEYFDAGPVAGFLIKVELFQSNGHAINDDMPGAGCFLATRK